MNITVYYTFIFMHTCIILLFVYSQIQLYACTQMCTDNFILCTASAESQSEKLKTAVLIVSLSWQEEAEIGGVSVDSGTAN